MSVDEADTHNRTWDQSHLLRSLLTKTANLLADVFHCLPNALVVLCHQLLQSYLLEEISRPARRRVSSCCSFVWEIRPFASKGAFASHVDLRRSIRKEVCEVHELSRIFKRHFLPPLKPHQLWSLHLNRYLPANILEDLVICRVYFVRFLIGAVVTPHDDVPSIVIPRFSNANTQRTVLFVKDDKRARGVESYTPYFLWGDVLSLRECIL
mmetsp:Transcript_1263/g.2028  ORF Transcript_1263/g.2028 Transcript_1263/m.2028 type:complete len:210 (+) Transcript_1263:1342-1971(+)